MPAPPGQVGVHVSGVHISHARVRPFLDEVETEAVEGVPADPLALLDQARDHVFLEAVHQRREVDCDAPVRLLVLFGTVVLATNERLDVLQVGLGRELLFTVPVVALRRGPVIYELRTWRGLDTMETVQRVVEIWDELDQDSRARVDSVFVDSIGIGRGVYNRLEETHITQGRLIGQTRFG